MSLTPNDDDDDSELVPSSDEIGNFVVERPLAALAIAAVIGFVLARIIL